MSQTINVELTVNGDTDVLVFKLDDETPDKYVINLTSESDQEKIKEVFTKLKDYLTAEMNAVNDNTMQQEIDILEKLIK